MFLYKLSESAQLNSTFHVASVHRASKDLDLGIKNSSFGYLVPPPLPQTKYGYLEIY